MKKVFGFLLVVLGLVALAGCEGFMTNPVVETFVFELESLSDDTLVSVRIPYVQDDPRSNLEIIEAYVTLDYDVYDFGVFVKGIDGHYPREFNVTYNYWFALYVNDEMSDVGITDVSFEKDMRITFRESTSLDATGVLVDEIILGFVASELDYYVSETTINHHVMAALAVLKNAGHEISAMDRYRDLAEPYLQNLGTATISNLFKSAVINQAMSLGMTFAYDTLVATNHYDAVTLLSALDLLGASSEPKEGLIDLLVTSTPAYMDADYAGMLLEALAGHDATDGVLAMRETMLSALLADLTSNGMSSWGAANAASTANAIIGLVAQGIDPRGEAWEKEGTDLIEALLLYHEGNVFVWQANDPTPDMMFSTPQAFAALVVYKVYRDTWGNPATLLF